MQENLCLKKFTSQFILVSVFIVLNIKRIIFITTSGVYVMKSACKIVVTYLQQSFLNYNFISHRDLPRHSEFSIKGLSL